MTGDGLDFEGDVDGGGSMDNRSINCFSLSLSLSSWPDALLALSRSIWFRSCAPSDRLLLTNVSTFFFKLWTVPLISL